MTAISISHTKTPLQTKEKPQLKTIEKLTFAEIEVRPLRNTHTRNLQIIQRTIQPGIPGSSHELQDIGDVGPMDNAHICAERRWLLSASDPTNRNGT